ncbi:hypothetical protein CRE_25857 [Caenorhabditis remanei]|uniref:BMERB domain-containing protein n=2 Tax=Caenorhabditis remanei TaxID=31234 RepID=E3NDR5_CAERE|nr:hypothetical protein CRE_25857 [Caenorhabditis remanei]
MTDLESKRNELRLLRECLLDDQARLAEKKASPEWMDLDVSLRDNEETRLVELRTYIRLAEWEVRQLEERERLERQTLRHNG